MAAIEMNAFDAVLTEGAAVRVSTDARRGDDGETHVYFDACEEGKAINITDVCDNTTGLGRMLDVTMTLRNVCPGRRCAVGVAITEVDNAGNEYARGFRAVTVPAHNHSSCCDVPISCMRFVLPEDLRVDGGENATCGCRRHFIVRSTNHYIDSVSN